MSGLGEMSQREYLDECRKLDIERHERNVGLLRELVESLPGLGALHKPSREEIRASYVRHYAAIILSGLVHPYNGCASVSDWNWDELLTVSMEQAGRLFDKTEAAK